MFCIELEANLKGKSLLLHEQSTITLNSGFQRLIDLFEYECGTQES